MIKADKEKVLLLTSGAYVNSEIASDFGLLPASFLPVGHRRLFELQLDLFKDKDISKFITLPEDYVLLGRDRSFLRDCGVKIERVDPDLSLANSILDFFERLEGLDSKELYILHGDTLFNKVDLLSNILYYNYSDMFYKWGGLKEIIGNTPQIQAGKQAVVSGFFSFNNLLLLREELENKGSFESALSAYNTKQQLDCMIGEGWLDFGHENLYFRSKMKLNVTRAFNKNIANKNFINKSSENKRKISSEYNWFVEIPDYLGLYTPQVWGYNKSADSASYNIEFIGAPTIQEKWVFGNLPEFTYYKVVDNIFDLINRMSSVRAHHIEKSIVHKCFEELYITKTRKRIQDFCNQIDFDLDSSIIINDVEYLCLRKFSDDVLNVIDEDLKNESSFSLMHGDLCYSNILYDTRSDLIKVIDPRGGLNYEFDSDQNYTYGDYRYDIAKLGHSVVGNYDQIVTGFFNLKSDFTKYNFEFNLEHKKKQRVEDYFYEKVEETTVSRKFIKASIANLFISMLPLHDDDRNRQIALLLNAYTFYYN